MFRNCKCPKWWPVAAYVLALTAVVLGYVGYDRFFRDGGAGTFASDDERFKYGSIGAEFDAGMPYWLFVVMPRMFPEKLPGPGGYASLGANWEAGHELPVGFTKRTIGFPRVANNCAVCHTASYRGKADETPTLVPTGPNHMLNLEGYFRFLIDCAKDPRFNADNLMAQIDMLTDMDWLDRLAWRYLVIPMTKKRLLERETQFAWLYRHDFPDWGRGRDDAMNLTKYFLIQWKMDDTLGPTDMPSVWNLRKYKSELGQRLNWAGDSYDMHSVVIDSALGVLGAAPHDKQDFLQQVAWLEDYFGNKRAPAYPFAIDRGRVAHGKQLFDRECAGCHASARTGTTIPLAEIGTDPGRIQTWGKQAAVEANQAVQKMGIERKGLVEAPLTGYQAQYLDGIWLRAPYLHNGSVPSLRALLMPPAQRPRVFYRGYDVYDPANVGFVSQGTEAARVGTVIDTARRSNGNGGHEYGTRLPEPDKQALVEYLKTL